MTATQDRPIVSLPAGACCTEQPANLEPGEAMDNPDQIDAMGATLRFLADTTRLQILQLLLKRELCVCELTEQLEMSQPLMSYHLRKLRDAGLVRTRRKAQWIYYSIDPAAWQGLLAPLLSSYLVTELPPEAAFGASDHCDDARPIAFPATRPIRTSR